MANCCNCSAPLPLNSIRCEYCGSRNDIDLNEINYYTTNSVDSERTCPRCSIPLRTVNLKADGAFLIERCDECLGLFFDPGELEALLESTVTNVFTINRSQLESLNAPRSADYGVSYIKCPVCSGFMNRVNFGARSGVIVDRCKDHGVWLDGGELRHLFEWVKAGGQLLQKEKEEQLKKTQEREHAREILRNSGDSAHGGGSADEAVTLFGGTLRSGDPDLLDVVREVIRFFTR